MTRSAAEWRRIGLDDEDEFAVAENRHLKIERIDENDMVISDVFDGDSTNDASPDTSYMRYPCPI